MMSAPPAPGWRPRVLAPQKKTLVVGVADMIASNDPSADLITYSLGSCLGVAIYDPVAKVGGLLHLMLPDSTIDAEKAQNQPCMFVDTGLPRLFRTVYGLGGDKYRLVVKVAGGSNVMDAAGRFKIGDRNIEALDACLQRNHFQVAARDVGGTISRTLRIELGTGNVTIQSPGVPPRQL